MLRSVCSNICQSLLTIKIRHVSFDQVRVQVLRLGRRFLGTCLALQILNLLGPRFLGTCLALQILNLPGPRFLGTWLALQLLNLSVSAFFGLLGLIILRRLVMNTISILSIEGPGVLAVQGEPFGRFRQPGGKISENLRCNRSLSKCLAVLLMYEPCTVIGAEKLQ